MRIVKRRIFCGNALTAHSLKIGTHGANELASPFLKYEIERETSLQSQKKLVLHFQLSALDRFNILVHCFILYKYLKSTHRKSLKHPVQPACSNIYRYFILRVANLQSIWEAGKQYCEKTFFNVLNYQSHILFLLFYRELFDQLKVEEPISNIPIFCYAALSLAYQENVVFAIRNIPIFSYAALSLAYQENVIFALEASQSFPSRHSHLPIRKMSSLP